MRAVVLRGPGRLELADVPVPHLTDDRHVLINVKACGVCGSDLRYWAGENPWALHTLGRHVDNPPNIIMGHEFAGVVVEVNCAADRHLLGQRVGVQAYRTCGKCRFCVSERHNLCRHTVHLGHAQGWGTMDIYPGAYAEFCPAWGDLLYPLPEDVSFEEAAMADVLCVAVHVVGRSNIRPDSDVLCIGGGPVGLCIAQVARARGARRVFISETSAVAQQVLKQYDFAVIDPGRECLADAIARMADGSVAAVYDSVGDAATISTGIALLEESGTYVNLAVQRVQIPLNAALLASEKTITTSSNAFYSDVAEAYKLIFSKRVDFGPMITHCFALEEYQRAFDLLLGKPKKSYKAMFHPSAAAGGVSRS